MLVYQRVCYGILHTLQLFGQRQLGNPAVEILKAPRHPIPKFWGTIFSPDVALIFCFEKKTSENNDENEWSGILPTVHI